MTEFCKILNWIEQFCKIRTKTGKVTHVRFNPLQVLLYNWIAWCWHRGVPVRAVIPKFRQGGVSLAITLYEYALCELRPGYRVGLVAHSDDGAEEIFGKAQTIKKGLKKSKWGTSELKTDQSAAIVWDSESSFEAATIKTGDSLGKGGSLSAVHFSEVASFKDKNFGVQAKMAIESIINSAADSHLYMEVYESTAHGHDEIFHPLCEKARDPNSDSTNQLIFLPWFLDQGYSMTWERFRRERLARGKTDPGRTFEPNEEESQLRERLATAVVEPHEALFRYRTKLSDEQLIWRRWTIANKCGGDRDTFYRYYPSFYEECFTASSTAMFEKETIAHYRATSRNPIRQGTLAKGLPLSFFSEPGGPIRIWAMPMPHATYVLAADVGGSTPKSDPSCAFVVHRASLEIVASIHGKLEWDDFADLIFDLGCFYNQAEVCVENNYNPAVADRLHKRRYKNLYYYFAEQTLDAHHGKTPGFNTNKKTRPVILSNFRMITRPDPDNHDKRRAVLNDPDMWKEMETFVWHPKASSKNPDMEGDWRASGGNHDDRIMTAAIAYSRCPDEPTEEPDVPPEPVKSKAVELFEMIQAKLKGSRPKAIHHL